MQKINFIIAGAQKAGTSSLKYYLGQHPDICTHTRLEFSYFIDEKDYKQGYNKNYIRYFSHINKEQIILAKSVSILSDENFIKRMYKHNKNLKFVFVMRNPVDRAYSSYWYSKSESWENSNSFEEALKRENYKNRVHKNNTDYLFMSNYQLQLECL